MQTTIHSTAPVRPKAVILITLCLLLATLAMDYPNLVSGNFFSDCATYYGLAESLAHDFDTVYAREDLQRYYAEFSGGPSGIFIQRNSETGLLYYGKSFIYPLWAAPFVKFLGKDGFLFSHALLFGLFVAGIVKLWERHWGYWNALLIALAAATASTAVVFFFWVAPEYFNMVIIFYAYFLVLYQYINPPEAKEPNPGILRKFFLSDAAVVVGFVFAGLATFSKISNGLYFLPLFLFLIYKRRFKVALLGLLAFFATATLLFGIQDVHTGNWNYQGGERTSFHAQFPYANNMDYYSAGGTPMATDAGKWEFPFHPVDIANNMSYQLFGRFGGMLPYFAPAFLILALLLFRRLGRIEFYLIAGGFLALLLLWLLGAFMPGSRDLLYFVFPVTLTAVLITSMRLGIARENMVLLSILASAMLYIVLIPTNVIGGGGTVGNRYFFNIYPLFFFLLPLRPKRWLSFFSYAIAFFFIGHIIFNPVFYSRFPHLYGSTEQLKLLPVEYTMINDLPINTNGDRRRMPWYAVEDGQAARFESGPQQGDLNILFYVYHLDDNSYVKEPNPNAWFPGPDGELTRNLVLPGGKQHIWTRGGKHAEFILRSGDEFEKITVRVSTAGVPNSGYVELNSVKYEFTLEKYSSTEFSFYPENPYVYHYLNPSIIYHLEVETDDGIAPRTLPDSPADDWRYLGVRLEFEVE